MLDLAILGLLRDVPRHGYELKQQLAELGFWKVSFGSLYPALHRMQKRKWLSGEWRTTSNKRRARYYALTTAGEAELRRQIEKWKGSSWAVDQVLGTETG